MKIELKTFLILLPVILFLSCSKERNENSSEKTAICTIDTIPSHWAVNGEIIGEFIYDEKGRIIEKRRYPNTGAYENKLYNEITHYEYDASGKLKSGYWMDDENFRYDATYYYSENRLDSMIFTFSEDHKVTYLVHENLSGDCLPTSYTEFDYYRFWQNETTEITHDYLNEACDYIKTRKVNGEFACKEQFTKSDKRNFKTNLWSAASFTMAFPEAYKYVISERCILDEDGSVVQCNPNLLDEMEFNDLGFVTKHYDTSPNGSELNYEYFYKASY